MVPMREAEATAREFANRFADGSVVDATALLTDEGRAAVVETFPDGSGRNRWTPKTRSNGTDRGSTHSTATCKA